MKRNKILIIILIVLAIVTACFIYMNRQGTYSEELSDFAVPDTAAIDKIFLADKIGNQVTLTRKSPGLWLVDNEFTARKDGINLLLECLKNMEVRSPVGKRAYENTVKRLAAHGVKCEIYQHGELVKTFYVGGATQDNMGTFMYLENSSVPFVTHIPGFQGFLTPRFFTSLNDWKDKTIFNYTSDQIEQIIISDKENETGNFKVVRNKSLNQFELFDTKTNSKIPANDDRINQYLSFYLMIAHEGIETKMPRQLYDSLMNNGWFRKIELATNDGKKQTVELFRKSQGRQTLQVFDDQNKALPFDPDRFYARLNNDTLMVLAQYQQFDKLFKNESDFSK